MKRRGVWNYIRQIRIVVLIFAMNLITTSLEFMRNEAVAMWPKLLLLIGAFLLYFLCLYALLIYAKAEMKQRKMLLLWAGLLSLVFVGLMLLFRNDMRLNILVSVLFVAAQFVLLKVRKHLAPNLSGKA